MFSKFEKLLKVLMIFFPMEKGDPLINIYVALISFQSVIILILLIPVQKSEY